MVRIMTLTEVLLIVILIVLLLQWAEYSPNAIIDKLKWEKFRLKQRWVRRSWPRRK